MPLAPQPDEDVEFALAHRRWCNPVVVELTLEVIEQRIDFDAGQYVLLQDTGRAVSMQSYSVANAPRSDGTLTFLVTAVPGGPTSTWLTKGAQPGDRVLVSGPYGSFVADPAHDGPTLYLVGGSGLAPAKALVEAAVARGETADPDPGSRHTLLFSGRTTEHLIDHETFAALTAQQPGFDYVRTLTRVDGSDVEPPRGRIPEVLPSLLPDLSEHAVYVAGAPGLVDASTKAAQRLGARAGRVHTEEFYAQPTPWSSGSGT